MTSLSDAANFAKKSLKWLIITLAVLGIIFVLVSSVKFLTSWVFPKKPPAPTVAFGKLPKIDFSEGIKAPANLTYSIETINGELPILANKVKVFAIKNEDLIFGDLQRTKIIASKVGFRDEPEMLSSREIKFTESGEIQKTLTIDIVSGNFILDSNYAQDIKIISAKPQSVEQAIQTAVSFLNNFGLNDTDLPPEKIQTKLLRIDGISLTEVPTINSANLVQVDFQRDDILKIPVINPQENAPLTQVLVSQNQIVAASQSRLPIELNLFASYPTKGIFKAFEDLKAGKGYLNKNPQDSSGFPIRDAYLAYLETKNSQGYLMPVYAFKSDKGLVAYVEAIDELWVK